MTDEGRLKLLQTIFPSTEVDNDGKLFKYKLKGDIVQSYEIVPFPCVYGLYMCNKDDFCSYGERKGGDSE